MLRPILDICDREMSYEGGGRRRDPWCQKTADRKRLSAMLKIFSRRQGRGVRNPEGVVREGVVGR